MSSTINRDNPGDLISQRGDSFLVSMNTDRDRIYGHSQALESALELLAVEAMGKGTLPSNAAECYVDTPTAGRVYCEVGYKAVIGGAVVETTAVISQAYSSGLLNHVFLVVSTAGALSLRVSTSATEGDNELWIADVSDAGVINNSPTGKAMAGVSLGTAADGTQGGGLNARYQAYTSNATPDAEDTVAHALGRTPVGYLVCCIDKAGIVYKGSTAWDSTNIYLKCNVASCAVTLLIW